MGTIGTISHSDAAAEAALSDHHYSMIVNPNTVPLSSCEREHRLRLRMAKATQGENILLHVGKYYGDKPKFSKINGIDHINTVSWTDTEYDAYICNKHAAKQFLKIGDIFLDKRSFHKYNLWSIAPHSIDDDGSGNTDHRGELRGDVVNSWGEPFLLKVIQREMSNIANLPNPECVLRRVLASDNSAIEVTKKSKKNNMENNHSDKSVARHRRRHPSGSKEKSKKAGNGIANDEKRRHEMAMSPINEPQYILDKPKQGRKRHRDDSTALECDAHVDLTMADLKISETLSVMTEAKRNKTAADIDVSVLFDAPEKEKALHNDTAGKDDKISVMDENSNDHCQITKEGKSQDNLSEPLRKVNAGKALTARNNLETRRLKRKKIKRPNITVYSIDPNRSLCWNMGNYIENHLFNGSEYIPDSKEMLKNLSKKAKKRRDRMRNLWQKYGQAFFDMQHPNHRLSSTNPNNIDNNTASLVYLSCYVDISPETLSRDLDINADYETILKILSGIDARFDTSVTQNMIDGQSSDSRFTLHVKDFFDLLRHLDDELMADWYEIYYKNQVLYASALLHAAASCHAEKMDVDND